MSIPEPPKPFYMKDMIDREIDRFAAQENPTQHDINRVSVVGQIQDGLDRYRAKSANMSYDELINEKHRSSRLGKMMTCAGELRPSSRCDAHAIISGGHSGAAPLRAVLAWCKRRIDDPINGCWLPRSEADKPPHLRKAVAHNRIHRHAYFQWLSGYITPATIKSDADLVRTLRMIKTRLKSSAIPKYIIPQV